MTEGKAIAELLEANGFEWAMQAYSPSDGAGDYYASKLDQLLSVLSERGLEESGPTAETLRQLAEARPDKLAATLEALVSIRTPEMMAAAWRVIQGMDIDEMSLQYFKAKTF